MENYSVISAAGMGFAAGGFLGELMDEFLVGVM
jgi:hypothetical protein